MAAHIDKVWDRPWTMEEIIENADNWTLAGDVALLNTLKSFADNMFQKTETITNNIDSLLNNVDEVQLKLDITQNEFYSLKNSQFIESRVYEDDETVDSKEDEQLVVQQITDDNQDKLIIESIKMGLDVMQSYYDNVEVSISDSEDEFERSYIIKPKDVYIHRPLPPLFGSEGWNDKWHMEDTSSESESEKVSEISSESEAENALPKDLLKGSETSSELDLYSHTSENKVVDNSTFNEPSKKTDSITSSDGSNGFQETEPVKVPTMGKSLVEQLTTTLGNIKSLQEDTGYEEINKRPIKPVKSDFIDRLFSEEPPPLDDIDGDEPTKPQIGIFSGGHGLFDDDEDDFWPSSSRETNITKVDEMGVNDKKYSDSPKRPDVKTSNSSQFASHRLFDSDNDDNTEDLFSNKSKQQKHQEKSYKDSFLATELPTDQVQEPPEEVFEKKPVGGVLLFGSSDIFNNQKVKNILNSNKGVMQVIPKIAETIENKNEAVVTSNKVSLFEETKPVIVDSITDKKKALSLFDDDDDDNGEAMNSINQNLSGSTDGKNNKGNISRNTITKEKSLFDDDDDDILKNDLFSSVPSKSSNLFDDFVENDYIFTIENQTKSHAVIKNKVDSLFSDIEEKDNDEFLDILIKSDTDKKSNTVTMKIESEIKVNDLFDGPEDDNFDFQEPITAPKVDQHFVVGTDDPISSSEKIEGTDLPTSTSNSMLCDKNVHYAPVEQLEIDIIHEVDKLTIPETMSKFDDLVEKSIPIKTSIVTPPRIDNKLDINLFGSTPPPVDDDDDDDEWDIKSDNSNSIDFLSYQAEDDRQADIFDNEPPSLCFNDTSGIVKDFTNTRMDSDDTSFNPHASSSRRLSSDIFSEQQSQDSFYVTKNQTTSMLFPPDLALIQENSSNSALSITPSGDVDVFETIDDKKIEEDNNSVTKSDDKDMSELLKSTVKTDNEEENDKGGRDNEEENDKGGSEFDGDKYIRSVSENVFPEPRNSISQLKHNLNINVNALRPSLPGSGIKYQSLADSKENPVNQSNLEVSKAIVSTEKAISFDDDIQNLECLPSITKARAKIPIKRKPSTRRGRQEAIRKSAADLIFDSDYNSQVQSVPMGSDLNPDVSSEVQREVHVAKDKGDLIEKIDQFDYNDVNDNLDPLFGLPKSEEEPLTLLSPTTITNKKSITSSNIFSQDDREAPSTLLSPTTITSKKSITSSNIFSQDDRDEPSTLLSPTTITNKKSITDSNIFSQDDRDEELFSATSKKSSSEKSKWSLFDSEDDTETDLFGKHSKLTSDSKKIKEASQKKILFDDSSSDDDLFAVSSRTNKSKHQGSSENVVRKSQIPSVIRKLENVEARDNPLSDIFK